METQSTDDVVALRVLLADVRVARAAKLLESGDTPVAEAKLTGVLRSNPDHSDALYQLGCLRATTGELPAAVQLLSRVTELRPKAKEAWKKLGKVQHLRGDLPAARECLTRAVRMSQTDSEAGAQLAQVLVELGNLARAEGSHEAAWSLYEGAMVVEPSCW